MTVPDFPSFDFVESEVKESLDAQDRRGDSLDAKAGLILGFAGLLAGVLLRAGVNTGASEYVALVFDFAVAMVALLAYRARSYPVISPEHLRDYLDHDATSTRLTVLDTRLLIYGETERALARKASLVNVALAGLLLAVAATAVASGLSLEGGPSADDRTRPEHRCAQEPGPHIEPARVSAGPGPHHVCPSPAQSR